MAFKFQDPDHDQNPEINVTSLIDIVFLLLIFFLLTTQFQRAKANYVELPNVTEEQGAKGLAQQDSVYFVVDQAGRFFHNGKEMGNLELEGFFKGFEEKNQKLILIEADGRAPHGRVLTLVTLLQKYGQKNIAFVTSE